MRHVRAHDYCLRLQENVPQVPYHFSVIRLIYLSVSVTVMNVTADHAMNRST